MLVEITKEYRKHGDTNKNVLNTVITDFGPGPAAEVTKIPLGTQDYYPWTQFDYVFHHGKDFVGWSHNSSETHIYIATDVDLFEEYVVLYSEYDTSDINNRISEATDYTHKQLPFYEWKIKTSVSLDYVVTETWEQRNL